MVVTVAEAKKSLPVIHDSDDDLIAVHIEAAQSYVEQYIGRAIPWPSADDPAVADSVPAQIKQAMLILVRDYYFQKDEGDIAVKRMISPFRVTWGV